MSTVLQIRDGIEYRQFERDLFLGIDPGQSGGIAILDRDGRIVHVEKMPETERDTVNLLEEFAPRIEFAVIEKVTPMPMGPNGERRQGFASTWKFGQHYGFLRGVLVALKLRFDQVRPQEWQASMSC